MSHATGTSPVDVELRTRSFTCRGTGPAPDVGDYVEIAAVGAVGYVEAVSVSTDGFRASGALIDEASAGTTVVTGTDVTPASTETVTGLLSGGDPHLYVGHLTGRGEVPVGLRADKLNRHTFWCGQSGSGKTYALGVLLERVLTATRLPLVVLDPNSDFVGLDSTVPDADPHEAAELAGREVVVLRPESTDHPLRVRFTDLPPRSKAAVLRLDPITDRLEYNALLRMGSEVADRDAAAVVPMMRALGTPEALLLAQRIENLGLLDWETVWAGDAPSATDVLDRRPAATVLDLGGYDDQEEQLTVTLGVLDHLWQRRAERKPLLLVIDEAHNLCPPEPDSPLGRAVRDRLVQIAAEGRKYGIWLLVSTQRPSKVHPGVVSQCDNLMLMRMTSRPDLAELGRTFGFVPDGLVTRAAHFRLGEALMAGGFVHRPAVVTMRTRVTRQGGSDVAVPLT